MKLILILFTVALALLACKPDPLVFVIEGTVQDQTFETGLNEGEVQLIAFPVGSQTGNVVGTNTLSSGSFSFEVKREQTEKFIIRLLNDHYFPTEQTLFFSDLVPNEPNLVALETTAKSFVQFNIKNQNQTSADDELKFLKYRGKTNCSDCCENQYTYFNGADVNEQQLCINDGNTYLSFYYWVNGNEIFVQDSVLSIPFDTVQYNIFY